MYALVQVRGIVDTRREIKETLKMLRLHHINHCVLVPETPEYIGMVRKVKDYIAFGEVNAGTLATILATRGRLTGNKHLTDEYVKSTTKYATIAELAAAIIAGEIRMKDVPELKPVLRMHPPRKGYKITKRTFNQGGALGYYGLEINDLLIKMR